MYERYKDVIRNIANKYAVGHPNNREELFSAACLGFCELDLTNLPDNLAKAKVIQKCKECCRDFIALDQTFPRGRWSYYQLLTEGNLPSQEPLYDVFVAKVDDMYLVIELINDLNLSPREHEVVTLFLAGYDRNEVADRVGVSVQRLQQIRHDIKEKILCLN
jgi:DNA-directed RNA polymerase specialized sigma subunit